jgi:hypothetical protein
LGLLLAEQEQYDEAIREFMAVTHSQSKAHLNLAHALALNNDLELAKVHARKALELDPQSSPAAVKLLAAIDRLKRGQDESGEEVRLARLEPSSSSPEEEQRLGIEENDPATDGEPGGIP